MADKELKNRVASVKNVQKITRAMEMISAARLRRAEQRIVALRPYASAIRRMTRHAAEAAENLPNVPILNKHDEVSKVGMLLVTSDRGLAGAFNGQIIRGGVRAAVELERAGKEVVFSASGRRGVGSLNFRKRTPVGAYVGFTDRPAYANAREIASDLIAAYVDGEVDEVEIFYNSYISPLQQRVTRETLLPLQQASILEEAEGDEQEEEQRTQQGHHRALVEYEPEPEEILRRLVPVYVEISIFRALLESTASEHGARMTAMRNASENAGELIDTYTLQMNRQRQADITQEIMEVVAGAESLT
ncbi:MAG TPA: ATP synthase F1 subunit gamma [Solirubrobacteraceae bacterium]|jgi:F-type H+-transporting ATPase subunit gamma|nr:ATP synthase F1 subunit gamma [Solirubrobacteraceae bacterium]